VVLLSQSLFETGYDFVLVVRVVWGALKLVLLMVLGRVWYLGM